MDDFIHNKYFKVFLIVIILIQIFLVVFHPHQTYKYPFHVDEWFHISEARRIIAGDEYHLNFEIGFDLFLAFLVKLGLNLVLIYKYLPAIFACISSLALFFLVRSQTRNFYLAALSMLFFMILPTNVNILGLKFFTPLTLAIPFIFAFVLLFIRGLEKQNIKLVVYSFLIFLALLFIHPVSATFMLPIIIIYAWPYKHFIIKNKLKFLLILLCPLTFSLIYSLVFKLNLYDLIALFKQYILFYKGWTPLEIEYSLIKLYRPILFLLASLGFFLAFKKKKLRIFVVWASVTFILLLIYALFDVSIFAPYQRMLYYFMLSVAPLSAIGFHKILSYLWKILPKTSAIFLIFMLTSLLLFYHISLNNSEGEQFYHAINDYAYEAIKFLEPLEKSTVIAPRNNLSIAVYPISGQKVIATRYFYGDENGSKLDLDSFFGADCSLKKEIAKDYNVSYVIDEENCGWEKIYDRGFKIYKTPYKE